MNSKKILATLGTATIVAAVMLPMLASAATDPFGINYGTYTGLTSTDIRITIANIIRTAMGLLGIVAVLIVLFGGFKWMTASGDTKAVDEAKKILIAGIIGLVIIVSAYAIATFVINSLVAATAS